MTDHLASKQKSMLFSPNNKSVNIDLRNAPYNRFSNIAGSTVYNDVMVRISTGSSFVGQYRLTNGLRSLSPGTVVTVTYPDGTGEKLMIVGAFGTVQAKPIAGTQVDQSGQPIPSACDGCETLEQLESQTGSSVRETAGGGNNEGSSSFMSSVWNYISGLWGGGRTGKIEVGEIEPLDKRK